MVRLPALFACLLLPVAALAAPSRPPPPSACRAPVLHAAFVADGRCCLAACPRPLSTRALVRGPASHTL